MFKTAFLFGVVFSLLTSVELFAQEGNQASGIPSIEQMRAEENYEFLKGNDSITFFLSPLKWIPLSLKKGVYLTLGGQYKSSFGISCKNLPTHVDSAV